MAIVRKQQSTVESIFENLAKKPSELSHPVDIFNLRLNGTKDWNQASAIVRTHVLDLVTHSKYDNSDTTRMIATACYGVFADSYFIDFFDFKRPNSSNVISVEKQKKARIVLVWDFNSQDWRYINVNNWYVVGALPLFKDGGYSLENIIRLALWYKLTYKPTTDFRHERFKTFK